MKLLVALGIGLGLLWGYEERPDEMMHLVGALVLGFFVYGILREMSRN